MVQNSTESVGQWNTSDFRWVRKTASQGNGSDDVTLTDSWFLIFTWINHFRLAPAKTLGNLCHGRYRQMYWTECVTLMGQQWANNITVSWRDAGPTILLSVHVTEGQQYYCLSTWHWAKYYCLSTWHWANNITISTLGQQCYCLSTWRWANNITVSPRDTEPNITVSPRDTEPIILPSLHVTLGQQYYCLSTWR